MEQAKQDFLKRAEARIDAKLSLMKTDSNGVVFARGQLEKIEETVFDVLFQDSQEAFKHIPMKPRFEPGMTSYSYRMETATGLATLMHHESQVRPVIDTSLAKTELSIVEFGASYVYSVSDGERAAILDYDQAQARAKRCAEAVVRAHNTFALTGDTSISRTGFLNSAAVADATLTDGDWSSGFTAAGAYADVTDVISKVSEQSLGQHNVSDVLLSLSIFNTVAATRIDSTSGQSVLDALRSNNPGVTFHKVAACTAAGDSAKDLVVAYEKNADRVEYVSTVLYDEAAPNADGYMNKVQARGKAAGTVIRYPLSMAYGNITV